MFGFHLASLDLRQHSDVHARVVGEVLAQGAAGGYGEPLTVGDELFCAIEHPSGLNRGYDGKVSLLHFPGKWLSPGQSLRTNSAILGVSAAGQAHRAS